jgi:DNA-directed RNA polymerase beta subunit
LEKDGVYEPILPHNARLRNLTYQTEIYVAVEIKRLEKGTDRGGGILPVVEEKILY